ncbi:keratin, type I cytoskeletal 9-like, partial [Ruditapes philippinarum]|uniref:keratin, type I cytoskeletal 9-like n=1 Tax=Ruditapes philippinarum TaxID=129788 RepID=UPI00295AB03F
MKGGSLSGNAYTQQEVVVNSTQEVMVTYVKSPNNFQVVLEKMTASLDYVMDQLHEYYDKLPPGSNKLVNPTLGQACVAQFTDDKGWYRALVTGLMADGQAEVMYVDYGNNEYTEKDALKEIQQQFMSLPAQAVQCRLSGVSSSQGFWSPEHIVQFTEMVEEQSFMATFKAELHEQGQTMYKVELVDKKGNNINQKFGTMTGTTCSEEDSGPCSRSVSAGKFGQSIKVTVAGGEEDSNWEDGGNSGFGGKARSFGSGRQPSGGSSGFGSRSSGFGNKQSSGGRDGGWDDNDTGGSSSGFGSKKPFGSSGGDGFGSNGGGGSGFGSSGRGGGSFGSSGGGGFGSSSGGGFGSSSGGSGFGKSSGFGSSAGGGGSKDCFKCGESGHFSRECPNAAKGGGRDCYKCGESGHMARDCTNPPKDGAGPRKGFGGGSDRSS